MLKLQCFIGWVVTAVLFSVFVSTIYIIYRFDTGHFNWLTTKLAWRSKHFIRPYILSKISNYLIFASSLHDTFGQRHKPAPAGQWVLASKFHYQDNDALMISVCGVHFDDSDKWENKKDSVKDFIAFWLLFVYQKGISEYKNMILSSLHQRGPQVTGQLIKNVLM